jgi:hypothetical protein
MSAEELLARVEAGGLLAGPAPVLAMLSGGRDSVCMLDLAVRARGPEGVSALHVNYGLREEAGEDERHCTELCLRLGVSLEVVRPRRPEGAGNLQAWAREERYAAAARLADPATQPDDAWTAAALAKAAAGDAAAGCARTAVQVHGALGQTWEHDVHLYVRRAWQGAALLGDSRALYHEVGRRFCGGAA